MASINRTVFSSSIVFIALFLNACSVHNRLQPASNAVRLSGEADQHYSSFAPDTLYDLMVAELGGHRQRYDLALGNYLKQAHKTEDVGVVKRAYQIASFVGAKQATLDAAMLWVKLAPDDAVALKASAFAFMQNGNYQQAIERMEQVLAQNSAADFDGLTTLSAQLPDQDKTLLLSAFSKVVSKYPDNASLALGQANMFQQLKRYEEALAVCDRLIEKDHDSIKAIMTKGRILSDMGRDEEAERMLAKTVNTFPNRDHLRMLYARVLVRASKLPEAREQFEILQLQSPNDTEVILSLALIAMDSNMDDEAEGYFLRLLALGQRLNTANFYLGKLSEKHKKWEKAQTYYSAITPSKEFMMGQVAMAQMLANLGHWDKARMELNTARTLYPGHSEHLFLLEGEILVKRGDYKDAFELYNRGLQRHPGAINLLYSRGMVTKMLGDLNGMVKDMKAILAMQPDNAIVLNALGYTLASETDRLDEANVLISKAYAINSEDPAIMDSMGWIQYRLGHPAKALVLLEAAYKKFPDAEVAAHLGEVLWTLDRREEARALWAAALKKQPDNKLLIETVNRLESDKGGATLPKVPQKAPSPSTKKP
ncbi:tetratricopeptide repeat protein [Candidatus Sororendozoicomonas aggregata]|uniref:tetratricopeptide repeat protein n=1 Tax=Candidatus Sororendozoicomonas aggregata TaxID=3073239 RepID=UPI002ED3D40F